MSGNNSDEFKQLLSRYEKSKRSGKPCYLDIDDYIDLSDYYLDNEHSAEALDVVDEGIRLHPHDDVLPAVRAGILIYLHRYSEGRALVDTLDADKNFDVIYLQAQLKFAVDEDMDAADELFRTWLRFIEDEWYYDKNDVANGGIISDEEGDEFSVEEAETELRNAYMHIMMSYVELTPDGRSSEQMVESVEYMDHLRRWGETYVERFEELGKYDADYTVADICRNAPFLELTAKIYERLLDTDPYTQFGWTILAGVQQQLGNDEEALNSVEFALAINPNDLAALLTKSNILLSLTNYEQALDCLLRYRRLSNSEAEDHAIAMCYFALDNADEASKYWPSALHYAEQHCEDEKALAWQYYEVAEGLIRLGRLTEGEQVLEKALAILPENIDFNMLKYYLLLDKGNADDAIELIRTLASNHQRELPRLLFSAGIFALATNYDNLAEYLFAAVQQINFDLEDFPQHDELFAYISYVRLKLNEVEVALEYLKVACEKTPELVKKLYSDYLPDTVLPVDYYAFLEHIINKKIK